MKYVSILLFCLLAKPFLLAQGLFTKVTDSTNPVTNFPNTAAQYKGLAWVDFDHDGLTDLFTSQYFRFKNLGDGKFLRISDLPDQALGQGSAGSSWADIDNDGHLDCITTGTSSTLMIDNGNGTFLNATNTLSDFTDYAAWDCALADVNNDGLLDLTYVHACCVFHTGPQQRNRFYLQGSGLTFTRQTGYAFTDSLAAYTIPIWTDYDLDGDLDLFIGSGPAQNPPGALPDYNYKNMLKETGSFSLQRLASFPFNVTQDGQVYNFIDYDNDGDLDICLTNYSQANSRFYRNDQGTYVSLTTPFTNIALRLANTWGDFDNDGDLDVLLSRDNAGVVQIFKNNGNGSFASGKVAGVVTTSASGVAISDYDNDGDLDFFANGPANSFGLFRNDTLATNRNWIQLTLEGTITNRSAIGARVRVKATINGTPTWQMREVSAHNSFQSQNDLRQHIGLAQATAVDSIEVKWPSGLVQHFANITPNRFYNLKEGNLLEPVIATHSPTKQIPIQISPNPSTANYTISATLAIEKIEVFDSTGRNIATTSNIQDQTATLSLSAGQAAGNYFVKVFFRGGKISVGHLVKI